MDDAHFMDAGSWDFLADLGQDTSTLCCISMRPIDDKSTLPDVALQVLSDSKTLTITLGGLDPEVMNDLACQILDVSSVPPEIIR